MLRLVFARLAVLAATVAVGVPPRGEVTKHTFAASKIFPGTTREYSIYVPKQYDPSKPACVYVNQDGVQFNAPAVFDRLIDEGAMPVTIGVFVTPGRVKALSADASDRGNRSYEYDGLGDNYARFLLDELLPDVETRTTADGRAIRLSKDGDDRAIGGSSSGAIAAFNVAWERPDAFTRVFTAIGTFVDIRGGNELRQLVRKVEPRPIRVFLEDGSGDLNNPFGDWWMANQEMERALTFAGYEVAHAWGTGGHNGNHATEVFPDAMRFLWKGYPAPVKAGEGSVELRRILIPGESWSLVGEGYRFTEGPTANARGEVFFTDIPANTSYKVGLDGKVAILNTDTHNANGQAFGPDGRLFAIATATSQVIAYDAEGKNPTVFADGFRGNDIVVAHDGRVFATNPIPSATEKGKLWSISPTGVKASIDTPLKYPNGVTLSPDQSLLLASDTRSRWVYSYQVRPDGTLAHEQKYVHLQVPDNADDSGADGLRFDRDGRLYVTTRMGIQVCDGEGRVFAVIPTPNGRVVNLCFGGPEFDTIFATSGDKVYKRKVKARGVQSYDAPIKPAARR